MDTSADNWAVVLHGVLDMRKQVVPMPSTPPGNILIQMKAVGICGSDIHYYTHGEIGPFVVKEPMHCGHESAGVVAHIPEGTQTSLQVGDAVALEPGVPCSTCAQCRAGLYNLCPDMKFFATPPVHGSLARYVSHPACWCFKLPPGMSAEEGALCEPLAVAVHACRRGGVTQGSRVLVTGAGPVGLLCAMTARAFGASHVTLTDVNVGRLAFAAQHGMAHATVHVAGLSPQEAAAKVKQAAGGPANVVIECCGFTQAVQTAIYSSAPGAAVVLVGMGSNEVALPLLEASVREVDLRPVFRYRNAYPAAVELIASGAVNVKPLITHRIPVTSMEGPQPAQAQEAVQGFDIARDPTAGSIKVMFTL